MASALRAALIAMGARARIPRAPCQLPPLAAMFVTIVRWVTGANAWTLSQPRCRHDDAQAEVRA